MANGVWRKIQGLVNGFLKFGFAGPMVKKNETDNDQLDVVANNGSSDAKLKAAVLKGKIIEVLDANGRKTTIQQPALSADQTMSLPVAPGNAGDSLRTDGAGNLYYSGGGDAADLSAYKLVLNYNTASPADLLSLPAGFRVKEIALQVMTPFDGTAPGVSIGIAGDVERYVANVDVDLSNLGKYIIDVEQNEDVATSVIATLAPDASTEGQVEVVLNGYVPQDL